MTGTLLITGASRGIGAAVARGAAREGYRIAVNYLSNAKAAEKVVADCAAAGAEAFAVQGDVASESDVMAVFAAVDERFGPLTHFVNNAGVVDVACRVDGMSEARLQRMMRINVIGAFLCAREAVRRMSTRHGGAGGAIVNLSSAAAYLGGAGQYVDYAASKGAIDTLTKGLSLEVAGEGIRVNAVRPGVIETEIHASGGQPDRAERLAPQVPMQRAGSAAEVAELVLFLLSDRASYSTGAFFDVTGGR